MKRTQQQEEQINSLKAQVELALNAISKLNRNSSKLDISDEIRKDLRKGVLEKVTQIRDEDITDGKSIKLTVYNDHGKGQVTIVKKQKKK